MQIKLPAEWEPQDGVLLSWPHAATDWAGSLAQAEPVFVAMARAIGRFERVVIVTPEPEVVKRTLAEAGVDTGNITLLRVATNDTWTRDFGPITVLADGRPQPLDFTFNGWGNKFAAELDNRVNHTLSEDGILAMQARAIAMVLEGGSIESDGRGTLLTTARCLLNPNRNPDMTRDEISQVITAEFGLDRILWLEAGELEGDDTDSHIDILARFAPDDTILYVACTERDDVHYRELAAMRRELEAFRTRKGRPYLLAPLPMPAAIFSDDGQRLAATYANFLVINGAVLVPVYDDPMDATACEVIAAAFPGREIIPINCIPLIFQGGSLHCSTMQFPEGALA